MQLAMRTKEDLFNYSITLKINKDLVSLNKLKYRINLETFPFPLLNLLTIVVPQYFAVQFLLEEESKKQHLSLPVIAPAHSCTQPLIGLQTLALNYIHVPHEAN